MNTDSNVERETLITWVLGARSIVEIECAERALHQWMQAHPEDLGMVDGFEQLASMRECAGAKELEPEKALTDPNQITEAASTPRT